jgi:hypothetical protein
MLSGGTGVQSQRDTIISSGNRLRDIAGITALWALVFALGYSCGALARVGPDEWKIRESVAQEVPDQVRLILLP